MANECVIRMTYDYIQIFLDFLIIWAGRPNAPKHCGIEKKKNKKVHNFYSSYISIHFQQTLFTNQVFRYIGIRTKKATFTQFKADFLYATFHENLCSNLLANLIP